MEFLRKYATSTILTFPLIKVDDTDFATSANYTPAASDTRVIIDAGTPANSASLPSFIGDGLWGLSMTGAELTGRKISIRLNDTAIEDQMLLIATFGNAVAEYAFDFSTPLAGPGATAHTIQVIQNGTAIQGADVWVTSDIAGDTFVAGTLRTNSDGNVTFYLDAGTYYAWVQAVGYNSSDLPISFTVS